ncbi:MAG: hypothetical protein ACI8ZM_001226 [Crocinitomix sp.]|jgi:hypothetical protein
MKFRYLFLSMFCLLLLQSINADEQITFSKFNTIASIDTDYSNGLFNPFVKGDLTYMRISQSNDATLMLEFDLDTRHPDSLFYSYDLMDSLGYKNIDATYLDIQAITDNSIEVCYSPLNRDYNFKVNTSRHLGSGSYWMYQGAFRLTFDSQKISVISIHEELGTERKVCDYTILN